MDQGTLECCECGAYIGEFSEDVLEMIGETEMCGDGFCLAVEGR